MARFIFFFFFFIMLCSVVEARPLAEAESVDGRIRAVLSVSPDQPRLSDTILLMLEVRADSTIRFDMPEFGDAIGELKIVETTESLVDVTDAGEMKRLVLKIVPNQGGTAPIWPIVIRYVDRREEVGRESVITLPASNLEIEAEVTPENASLEKISDAPDIFDLRSGHYWIAVAMGAVTLAVLTIMLLLLRRKKTEIVTPESLLSSQEIALRRITQLVESRIYENDVKRFFIELTGIVRWYIECRTKIRAPELTTEEFLHEISQQWQRRSMLPSELRDRLRLFLESADMVKFAKFRPSQDEIMLGLRRAEEFVLKFDPRPEDEFSSFNAV